MACPFCGCSNGFSGSPGYEPGDDDFARAHRAAALLKELAESVGAMTDEEREETRTLLGDLYPTAP